MASTGMPGEDVEARLGSLEAEVARLRDELDVLRVVASYAPSIDGGAASEAPKFWTEDCVYDSDADKPLRGRAAIEALSARVGQLSIGAAHFMNLPVIVVDGDQATVTGESHTFHQEDGRYVVARVSANRWELVRVDGTWQVRSRVNRILDGTEAGREILARGMRESNAHLGLRTSGS
jgi:ketosteroid isomerase-like protein